MAKRTKISTAVLDGVSSKHGEMRMSEPSGPAVRVECPLEGETISQACYSFHIAAAPGAEGVEVSIDKGEWMPCREALGIWWYDWSGFAKGAHMLRARARITDGIAVSSSPRRFTVA